MIESSCFSNDILMQSICYKKEKFINEGKERESLFLIIKRNSKDFYHFFFIFVTKVA